MAIVKGIHNRTPHTVTVKWGSPSNEHGISSGVVYHFDDPVTLPSSGTSFELAIGASVNQANVHVKANEMLVSCDFGGGWYSMPTTEGNMGDHLILIVRVVVLENNSDFEGIVIGDWEVAPPPDRGL
jgi:hypothetical protein